MKTAVIFLTDGFEEMEAIVPADILRRAGVDVTLVSTTGNFDVTGSHDIKVTADELLGDGVKITADMLILPGGPGAGAYIKNAPLTDLLKRQNSRGGYIAAICAAPVTLGKLGLLDNKTATCFPAMKDELIAGTYKPDEVVIDGNIITGRAAGAAPVFGLALAGILISEEEKHRVKNAMYIS